MKSRKKLITSLAILSVTALIALGLGTYFYFSNNFEGKVIEKYAGGCFDICLSGSSPKFIVIDYWRGRKEFGILDDKAYAGIQVGSTYQFSKDGYWNNFIKIKQ